MIDRKKRNYKSVDKVYEKSKLSDIDYGILEILAQNARSSHSEIARKLVSMGIVDSFTGEAITYRIKKLERSGWLRGSWVILAPQARKILYSKIQIQIEQIKQGSLERLQEFCRQHPNVVALLRTIGSHDFDIDVEVDDYQQAKDIVMQMTKVTPGSLRRFDMLMVDSLHKWDYSSVIKLARERGALPHN